LNTTAGQRDRALCCCSASPRRCAAGSWSGSTPGQTPGDPAGHGWIEFCDEGIRVRLARSKTDQQGEGRSIGVPLGVHPDTCPMTAVKAWLDHAGIVHGPLFPPVGRAGTLRLDRLSDRSVALIVKRAAEAAGLGPTGYAGHSLRSGHATKVAMNDGDERTIQAQLGHASAQMTRRYIREANIFRRSSAGKLCLQKASVHLAVDHAPIFQRAMTCQFSCWPSGHLSRPPHRSYKNIFFSCIQVPELCRS
jgi:Phage integrase family